MRSVRTFTVADRYLNFQQLENSETEGQDFAIRYSDRESKLLILGPHAGAIEPGTSEIVLSVADNDLSFYLFEGIKNGGNGVLHITSTNFDEPQALKMVKASEKVITFHGECSNRNVVYLGGRDEEFRNHLKHSLDAAGFTTKEHENPNLQGTSANNICNRCASGVGVQLELGKGLRRNLFKSLNSIGRINPTEELEKFTNAIRHGLKSAGAF